MSAQLSRTDLDAGLAFGLTAAELLVLLLVALLFGFAGILQYMALEGDRARASAGAIPIFGVSSRTAASAQDAALRGTAAQGAGTAREQEAAAAPGPVGTRGGVVRLVPGAASAPGGGAASAGASDAGIPGSADPGGTSASGGGLVGPGTMGRASAPAPLGFPGAPGSLNSSSGINALGGMGAAAGNGAAPAGAGTPAGPAASRDGVGEQLRNSGLEAALREAKRENETLRASVAELSRLRELTDAAAKINPAAPAATVIKDALRVLETVGPTADPVRAVQQLKSEGDRLRGTQGELQDYERLVEAAIKLDPNTPPATTLQRALSSYEPGRDITQSIRAPGAAAKPASGGEDGRLAAGSDEDESAAGDGARGGKGGGGAQPCWINQAGETEYLFEITIRDQRLTLRNVAPASRAGDPGMPLARTLARKGEFTPDDFKKAVAPLFRSSVQRGCRYVVQMRDGTSPDSKEEYKMWRALIESYFFVKPVS